MKKKNTYRQVSLVYTEKAIHYVVKKLKKGKQEARGPHRSPEHQLP